MNVQVNQRANGTREHLGAQLRLFGGETFWANAPKAQSKVHALEIFRSEFFIAIGEFGKQGFRPPSVINIRDVADYPSMHTEWAVVVVNSGIADVYVNLTTFLESDIRQITCTAKHEAFHVISNHSVCTCDEFENFLRERYGGKVKNLEDDLALKLLAIRLFKIIDEGMAILEELAFYQGKQRVRSDSLLTHGLVIANNYDYGVYLRILRRMKEDDRNVIDQNTHYLVSETGAPKMILCPASCLAMPTIFTLLGKTGNSLRTLEAKILGGGPEGILRFYAELQREDFSQWQGFVSAHRDNILQVTSSLDISRATGLARE